MLVEGVGPAQVVVDVDSGDGMKDENHASLVGGAVVYRDSFPCGKGYRHLAGLEKEDWEVLMIHGEQAHKGAKKLRVSSGHVERPALRVVKNFVGPLSSIR